MNEIIIKTDNSFYFLISFHTKLLAEDWAQIFNEGELLHSQTFDISDEYVYGKETLMSVLFREKVWMCFHKYEIFLNGTKSHDFWCEESNLEE